MNNAHEEIQLTGVEKIKALKTKIDKERLEQQQERQRHEEQENESRKKEYELGKTELENLQQRKAAIEDELKEIKAKRAEIITSGHEAKQLAKGDGDVLSTIKTKEGFDETFAVEKKEWKELGKQVTALNKELKGIDEDLIKKEENLAELYAATDEGKEEIKKRETSEKDARLAKAREIITTEFPKAIENGNRKKTRGSNFYFDRVDRMDYMKQTLGNLSRASAIEFPVVEGVSDEEYNQAVAEYLFDQFTPGFKADIKNSNAEQEAKKELAEQFALVRFDREHANEMSDLSDIETVNSFVEKNGAHIGEYKIKLEQGFKDLLQYWKTLFNKESLDKETRDKIGDLDIEKYAEDLPQTAEDIKFTFYNYTSDTIMIPVITSVCNEKISPDMSALKKSLSAKKSLLRDKESATFSLGKKELKKEIETLKDQEEFLGSTYNKMWSSAREKIDKIKTSEKETIPRQYNMPESQREVSLPRGMVMLLKGFQNTYADKLLGSGAVPEYQKEVTLATFFDNMRYITINPEYEELQKTQEQLEERIQNADKKFKEKMKA